MDDLEREIEETANRLLRGKEEVKVLEAGCGIASYFNFGARTYLVGIDISDQQLQQNDVIQERILGDIQTYPLPRNEFDVVVCWMVLEHLSRPKDALANMFRSLKPGGILILGIPNLLSVKGMVTKFTPFPFHKAFYRFMRYTSEHFPTYLRTAIIPGRIVKYAEREGLQLELCRLTEGGVSRRLRERVRSIDNSFSFMEIFVRAISFGRLKSPLLDACGMILKKTD